MIQYIFLSFYIFVRDIISAVQEISAVPQPPKVEPKALPMEPAAPGKCGFLFVLPFKLTLKQHRTVLLSPLVPVQKTLSMQNLTQIETPWENVTLNRCLIVAISILVLTSGFQRLHGERIKKMAEVQTFEDKSQCMPTVTECCLFNVTETLRGQRIAEEEQEIELTGRQPNTLRHRGKPPQVK